MLGFACALIAYLDRPSFWRSALIGGALGLATLCKFTAPIFAPFAVAAPALAYFHPKRKSDGHPRRIILVAHVATIFFVVWMSLIAGYLGRDISFFKGKDLKSSAMSSVSFIVRLVPLPREFVNGLDRQLYDAEQGEFKNGNYLFGKTYSGSKWYYYLVAMGVKEPVPHLVLLILAITILLVGRPFDLNLLALLLMATSFFLFAALYSSLQIGVRYLLIVYPLCFILMGQVGCVAFRVPKIHQQINRKRRVHHSLTGRDSPRLSRSLSLSVAFGSYWLRC